MNTFSKSTKSTPTACMEEDFFKESGLEKCLKKYIEEYKRFHMKHEDRDMRHWFYIQLIDKLSGINFLMGTEERYEDEKKVYETIKILRKINEEDIEITKIK